MKRKLALFPLLSQLGFVSSQLSVCVLNEKLGWESLEARVQNHDVDHIKLHSVISLLHHSKEQSNVPLLMCLLVYAS